MPVTDRTGVGTWRAVEPETGAVWFAALNVPWWFSGGWALDLWLGGRSRPHDDLDVGVLRRDIGAVLMAFSSWEVFEAKDGALTRVQDGEMPRLDVHSLWCR